LVIVDDWTPRTGHADKLAIKSVGELQSALDSKCPILMVSALYGDASGEQEWKVRGQAALDKISATTWLLTISSVGVGSVQKRILKVGEDEQYHLVIDDEGFSRI